MWVSVSASSKLFNGRNRYQGFKNTLKSHHIHIFSDDGDTCNNSLSKNCDRSAIVLSDTCRPNQMIKKVEMGRRNQMISDAVRLAGNENQIDYVDFVPLADFL